ncbi:glycoside hydrolase family 105 protein [Glaciecola sp. SC05]|uniref:glycoside hydrolase family 88/105 protein n=1 Tax=Glaciecola sp. SC05 TaxID=1987355 RepID=UPI00352980B7
MKLNQFSIVFVCALLTMACGERDAQSIDSGRIKATELDAFEDTQTAEAKANSALSEATILSATNAVAQWQLAHMSDFESYVPSLVHRTNEPRGWVQGTFFLGLSRWATATDNQGYFDYLRAHGDQQGWLLGPRDYHADDHVIAQYYLHIYDQDQKPEQIQPMLDVFENILANKPTSSLDFGPVGKYRDQDYEHDCQKRWCWSDALFMSPPVWFHLSRITGDDKYASYAHGEFKAVTDYLFDPKDHLYMRDSRFFDRREDNGEKIYWSRGNGWVFAGITKIMDTLDTDDSRYAYYADVYTKMAKSLADKQADDGYWPVSLAAGEIYTADESSGTAFFVAGLAWGINNGLLEKDEFMPVINKGWNALLRSQQDDGMLGYVQQIGYAPDAVSANDTQLYGAGAFLLAGVQMLELVQSR